MLNHAEFLQLKNPNLSHLARTLYIFYLRPEYQIGHVQIDLPTLAAQLVSYSPNFPVHPSSDQIGKILDELEALKLVSFLGPAKNIDKYQLPISVEQRLDEAYAVESYLRSINHPAVLGTKQTQDKHNSITLSSTQEQDTTKLHEPAVGSVSSSKTNPVLGPNNNSETTTISDSAMNAELGSECVSGSAFNLGAACDSGSTFAPSTAFNLGSALVSEANPVLNSASLAKTTFVSGSTFVSKTNTALSSTPVDHQAQPQDITAHPNLTSGYTYPIQNPSSMRNRPTYSSVAPASTLNTTRSYTPNNSRQSSNNVTGKKSNVTKGNIICSYADIDNYAATNPHYKSSSRRRKVYSNPDFPMAMNPAAFQDQDYYAQGHKQPVQTQSRYIQPRERYLQSQEHYVPRPEQYAPRQENYGPQRSVQSQAAFNRSMQSQVQHVLSRDVPQEQWQAQNLNQSQSQTQSQSQSNMQTQTQSQTQDQYRSTTQDLSYGRPLNSKQNSEYQAAFNPRANLAAAYQNTNHASFTPSQISVNLQNPTAFMASTAVQQSADFSTDPCAPALPQDAILQSPATTPDAANLPHSMRELPPKYNSQDLNTIKESAFNSSQANAFQPLSDNQPQYNQIASELPLESFTPQMTAQGPYTNAQEYLHQNTNRLSQHAKSLESMPYRAESINPSNNSSNLNIEPMYQDDTAYHNLSLDTRKAQLAAVLDDLKEPYQTSYNHALLDNVRHDVEAAQLGLEGAQPSVDGAQLGLNGIQSTQYSVEGAQIGVDRTQPGVDNTHKQPETKSMDSNLSSNSEQLELNAYSSSKTEHQDKAPAPQELIIASVDTHQDILESKKAPSSESQLSLSEVDYALPVAHTKTNLESLSNFKSVSNLDANLKKLPNTNIDSSAESQAKSFSAPNLEAKSESTLKSLSESEPSLSNTDSTLTATLPNDSSESFNKSPSTLLDNSKSGLLGKSQSGLLDVTPVSDNLSSLSREETSYKDPWRWQGAIFSLPLFNLPLVQQPSRPFKMHDAWEPGPSLAYAAHRAGLINYEYSQRDLKEFIAYWQTRPDRKNQINWELTFIQRLIKLNRLTDIKERSIHVPDYKKSRKNIYQTRMSVITGVKEYTSNPSADMFNLSSTEQATNKSRLDSAQNTLPHTLVPQDNLSQNHNHMGLTSEKVNESNSVSTKATQENTSTISDGKLNLYSTSANYGTLSSATGLAKYDTQDIIPGYTLPDDVSPFANGGIIVPPKLEEETPRLTVAELLDQIVELPVQDVEMILNYLSRKRKFAELFVEELSPNTEHTEQQSYEVSQMPQEPAYNQKPIVPSTVQQSYAETSIAQHFYKQQPSVQQSLKPSAYEQTSPKQSSYSLNSEHKSQVKARKRSKSEIEAYVPVDLEKLKPYME